MNANRVKALVFKEWEETRKNGLILLSAAIPALILAIMPAIKLHQLSGSLPPLIAIPEKTLREGFGMFLAFFFLLPVLLPSTIASYSIIGEKQNRTLEPLLATRITTTELLVGKSLACVIPSIILTWLTYAISVGVVAIVDGPKFIAVLWQPLIVVVLLLLAPMIAILSLLIILLVSARSTDPREAAQWTVFLLVPLVALGIATGTGYLTVGTGVLVLISAGVAVIDAMVLRFVAALFQRERILTRWK